MKIAIVYGTNSGATLDIAKMIQEQCSLEVYLLDAKKVKKAELQDVDVVIVGTAIYMFRPIRSIRKWAKKMQHMLKEKKVAFYTCGLDAEKNPREYLEKSFDLQHLNNAISIAYLGGDIRLEKLNPLFRAIMKKIIEEQSVSPKFYPEKVSAFVKTIEMELE